MERFKAFHFISFFQESLILKPIRKAILFFTYYVLLCLLLLIFCLLLFLFFLLSAKRWIISGDNNPFSLFPHCFLCPNRI